MTFTRYDMQIFILKNTKRDDTFLSFFFSLRSPLFPKSSIYKLQISTNSVPYSTLIDIERTSRFPKISLSLLNSQKSKKNRKEGRKSNLWISYRLSWRKYRFFASPFASSPKRVRNTSIPAHSNTERKRVTIAEATGTMSNQWSRRAKYRFTKRPFDQGPHTSTHGRAKSGWRIVVVQASSFKRFVVPREGVNRIHDSPRVSVDSNCLPFSLSSTIRNRDKTEANAPVRHRRIPLTATVFQSIARNREREREIFSLRRKRKLSNFQNREI